LRSESGYVRGDPVAGRFTARRVDVVGTSRSPLLVAGNLIRRRVQSRLGDTPEAGLLAGFLIGDTVALPEADVLALRRSGLTHYVAVSGSNVALVLGAWWLVVAPFGMGVRGRAITGMVVLGVFVVATRWESSVIRAATMAALVMGGRALGLPVDAWTALGGAVTLLLVVSGDLAYDVGFQLSVAATAGVLAGLGLWKHRSPRLFWGALAATISAQAAVVPLLLIHFGTIPLLSPLANLIAAPLVTAATALAGIGVIVGWSPATVVAEHVARVVLTVARAAADWPQLDFVAVAVSVSLVAVTWGSRWRTAAVTVVLVGNVVAALPPGVPDVPTVVFLDVGQGDAVLLRDPSGAIALVDGGRDPAVLRDSLRSHGVDRLDLVVASHGDADHVGGLESAFDRYEIDRLWVPAHQPTSELLREVVTSAELHSIPVEEVGAGIGVRLGEFQLEVLGPVRRYAESNDGSIVLLVKSGGVSVLLPGDIGALAQAELPRVEPDVLLVPHHGAGTTDLEWLARTAGRLAVISVGINSYGHPNPDVVATLRTIGSVTLTTRDEGDVVVPLR
jgi:competence protein ComEC